MGAASGRICPRHYNYRRQCQWPVYLAPRGDPRNRFPPLIDTRSGLILPAIWAYCTPRSSIRKMAESELPLTSAPMAETVECSATHRVRLAIRTPARPMSTSHLTTLRRPPMHSICLYDRNVKAFPFYAPFCFAQLGTLCAAGASPRRSLLVRQLSHVAAMS